MAENAVNYEREAVEALAMQATAWRLLAIIGSTDPEFIKKTAAWLLFNTVPFVNGEALQAFISDNQERAKECGVKSGIFAARTVPDTTP